MSIYDKTIKSVAEAAARVMAEKLHPNQQVLDVHEPEKDKLTAQDFKKLRAMKKEEAEVQQEGWDDMMKAVKERRGPQPSGGAGVKKGKAYGGSAQKDKPEHAIDKLVDKPKKKKLSEMVALYQEKGLKALSEMAKVEQLDEGSGPKEKQKTPHRDINSPEYRAAADKQKQKMAADKAAEPGKKLLSKMKKEEYEQLVEEPDNEQFTKEVEDQKASMAGKKKQPSVAAPSTQGVKTMPEEVQMDERALTEPEMKKKEEVVKSMKKKLSGFKDRYGDRAKEVMYATATKIAKKD